MKETECLVHILSVPTMRTSRKQKGKSRTDNPKYTPTDTHPYSLVSFLSLALSDDGSASFCAPSAACWAVRRGFDV